MENHEKKLIEKFIIKSKQERAAFFLSNVKRRKEFLKTLSHFNLFDNKYIIPIASNSTYYKFIYNYLIENRASNICYIISENRKLDGRFVDLSSALLDIMGYGLGTIISCIPGELAYFEGEDNSFF